MAKENILINKEKLIERIARSCPYFYEFEKGRKMCCKPVKGKCNVNDLDRIVADCPYDCPHFHDKRWKECKFVKCSYVKKAIKELQ